MRELGHDSTLPSKSELLRGSSLQRSALGVSRLRVRHMIVECCRVFEHVGPQFSSLFFFVNKNYGGDSSFPQCYASHYS